jgi:hypothetical protein
MKKSGSKSANMYVMFSLLAVLFVSLGYLSMQTKEGMMPAPPKKAGGKEGMMPTPPKKAGFKGGREGMEPKKENKMAYP